MELKKKELIISVIMVIAFLVVGFNLTVLATENNGFLPFPSTNNTNNSIFEGIIPSNNTTDNNANNTNNNTNANTNTPGQVPNTGLEDLPWVVIGICGVSAIFAYKKIKEYTEN